MRMSYSRVSSFEQCAYKWKLHYLDKREVLPNDDPQNALNLGKALHKGLEEGVDAGLAEYRSFYHGWTDLHYNEEIKLEHYIQRGLKLLPKGKVEHEIELKDDDKFIAFLDLVEHHDDGTVTIWDFKYANEKSVERYMESGQLPVYAYYFTKLTGLQVRELKYMLFPKVGIRQKKTEDLTQFRQRLRQTLTEKEILIFGVDNSQEKVLGYFEGVQDVLTATEYPKNETRLCDWCDFKKFCLQGDDTDMALPANKRREVGAENNKKKLWIYGAPFTGKTTLANEFEDPIMLNTDGNVKFVDAPFIHIKNQVEVEGRITKTTLAWQVFKDTISELERGSDFKTIVVDLVEDLYEASRLYSYDKHGWEHESDNSFKAYDVVRTEFLSTIKRLVALDYNIVLISHEDTSKDLTKRSGDKITSVRPNLSEKIATKIAGMVDVVARAVVIDGEHRISFKTDEVQFGGGRLKIENDVLPLDYEELISIYGPQKPTKVERSAKVEEPVEEATPEPEPEAVEETAPEPEADTPRPRRTRKVRD